MVAGENGLVEQKPEVVAPEEKRSLGFALEMRFSPKEAMRRLQELQAFVREVMILNVHYGTIPGTDKPTLYKPGAEFLCELYGLSWKIEWRDAVKDWENGFFYFEADCILRDRRTGDMVGNGIGSCNSRESKYAGRWEWADRCNGMDVRGLKQRRAGKKNDLQYFVRNEDIASLVNTIQKMAAKRAFIAAVLAATHSSGIFGQDLEDMPPEILEQLLGDEETVRTWEKGTPVEQAADLAASLLDKLDAAKTDAECCNVGATLVSLVSMGKLNSQSEQMVRQKIAAKRDTPEIKATKAKPAEAKPADAAKPSEAKPPETKTDVKPEEKPAATAQPAQQPKT